MSAEFDFYDLVCRISEGTIVLEVWRDTAAKYKKDIVSGRDEPSRGTRQGQRSELPGSSSQ